MGSRPDTEDRGATLVMSLVLLMILTMLAISIMRTAILQTSMAGNLQHKEKAFQLAAAGLAIAIERINDGGLTLDTSDGWERTGFVVGTINAPDDEYRVDLRYLYRGQPPPDPSRGDTEALYYELESTGMTRARNALSIQTRGFWVAGPNERPVNLTYWFSNEYR
jgi:hypothetical protein